MKYSVKIPAGIQGSLKHRVLNHIQGVCFTPNGIAFSRNGDKHGELILPNHSSERILFRHAHAGGIDACRKLIAVPLYDHGTNTGALTIVKPGWNGRYYHPLKHRAYAVAIEQTKGGFLAAIISNPLGTQIKWYRVPKALNGLEYLGETEPARGTEPRNNICLHWHKGEMLLYTMRSYFGMGTVVRYRIGIYDHADVSMIRSGLVCRRNGICAARFGATIRKAGHSDDVVLVKTARNIFSNRVRVRENTIKPDDWRW